MIIHELKIGAGHFQDIKDGNKTFEICRGGRHPPFNIGNTLRLREYDATYDTYSGREIIAAITYIATGVGLEKGYVALGIEKRQFIEGR